jgi:hypothetical protein
VAHALATRRAGVGPRLTQRARLVVVTIHVFTSVGMFGVTGALVVFQVAVGQLQTRSKPNPILDLVGTWVLTPMAVTGLATGVVLAVGSPWGLLRWRWIICKLQISAMLTVVGLVNLAGLLDPRSVLVARSCALVALVALVAVSVAKPWGRVKRLT